MVRSFSFEDLLDREWRSEKHQAGSSTPVRRNVSKKPFLKRGARGWWKDSAKAKPMAYMLSSEDGASPVEPKPKQPTLRTNTTILAPPKKASPIDTISDVQEFLARQREERAATFREQAAARPSAAPPREWDVQSSMLRLSLAADDRQAFDWSFSKSSDMDNLMQSYDWKIQQDAHDLEEFEYLEQTLLKETPPPPQTEEKDLLAELEDWAPEDIKASSFQNLDESEEELGFSTMQYFHDSKPQQNDDMLDNLSMSFADSEPWEETEEKPTHPSPKKAVVNDSSEPPFVNTRSYIQQKFQPPPPLPPVSTSPAAPPSSLQTLKMKLQQKAVPKSAIPKPKPVVKHPPAKPTREKTKEVSPPKPASKPASSSLQFPAVIDDKLNELEQEVKHYKQETLKLQKRREAFELEQRKLDLSRQEWLEEKRKAQDELEAEWKVIRKEKRALDQTMKFGNGILPDRKERSEVEGLKAQIVKMQMDEKAKASKHKAATDFFRHRIAELELRNQELRDELKFMEQERLANWNWTADEKPKTDVVQKKTNLVETELYNPSNYQEKHTFEQIHTTDMDYFGSENDDDRRNGATSPQHAFTKSKLSREEPFSMSNGVAGSPIVVEVKDTSQHVHFHLEDQPTEIRHPGGKVERRYASGPKSKTFLFANGTEKDVYVDGHTIVRFSNGDIKETYPSDGKTVYYYAAAQTRHTTYADQAQVFEFPNGQVEKHYASGMKEITFVDGTTKRIEVNGDEFSTFPDGTRMIEQKSGFREVINPDGSKARDYPDGRTTWVTPNGIEQPVQYKRPGP
ncbi:Aste57867_5647 [Aphanomyces stellatus]|uniref:Aste57867_5647 protein n=1 Tax=Aphanomyces stellatus TaxID=120398 RepID=A0A485KEI3_9STRA|nr:hypothetical protein As57867_005634 [Aphanomyces stellatus]VFT82693.1 Aste57867_5647 [Aphanomyces stellatus]